MKERYYSKVILFGEYSMIFDSTALMVPLRQFSAQWRFASHLLAQGAAASNASLQRFAEYLSTLNGIKDNLDLQRFNHELYYNLFLDSNVPSGYGLGSSGTLVAAVYDAYAKKKIDDYLKLKEIFGKMESYFHGSSSGIDPLQCYLGKPFKITPKGVELLSDDFLKKDIHVCLIDTKIKSNTKPLVDHFKKQRQNPEFLNRFQKEYTPLVKSCIDTMIQGDTNLFFKSLKQLTKGQLEFLRPMITDNTLDLFTADYNFNFGVKISGSGGGGYVLGFTDDVEKVNELLSLPCHSNVGMQGRRESMRGGFDVIWL
jgi:mevalonate kinase